MKLILHPLFILTVVIGAVAVSGIFMAAAVAAVLIHEFSHIWAARAFGVVAKEVRLLPFGAEVNIDCAFTGTREKILILLAGSFGNIAAALITSGFLWFFPEMFIVFECFIFANAIPAVLNLLPIYPLDGGKIVCLLRDTKKARFAMRLTSNAVAVVLLVIGIFVRNLPLIMFSIVMMLSVNLDMKKSTFTSKLIKPIKVNRHTIREVAIHTNMTLLQVYKLVSPKNYAKFIITDQANKSFYEDTLEKLLASHDTNTKLSACKIP